MRNIDKKQITNLQEAIDFLEDCKSCHQEYVDEPKFCNTQVGSPEFHQDCVNRYEEILRILKE